MATYEVARGTRDILPAEMAVRTRVEHAIRRTFESYGFQRIRTPLFEDFELFAARSGEEIRESMFTLVFDHQEYALRPELTAPVCRLVASGKLGELPRPYKLYYIGQCYRYGRPGPGEHREFTQAGLELMGSPDPLADAEVIAVAARTLQNLQVPDFRLKVGNVGISRQVLEGACGDDFDAQGRAIDDVDHLLRTRERCRALTAKDRLEPEDVEYVRSETETLARAGEDGSGGEAGVRPGAELSESAARELLAALPTAAEDACRAAWAADHVVPPEAGELLLRVSRVRGQAAPAIDEARQLLADTPAIERLDELAHVCELLAAYGLGDFEVVPGLARGLGFYTSTVFEIDCPPLGARQQVCGGGRYDRLVEDFGGEPLPATGFAIRFERVVELVRRRGAGASVAPIDVFVAAAGPDARAKAVETAEALRAAGLRAAVDVMGLDVASQLDHAARLRAAHCVVRGAEGLGEDECLLRRLPAGPEQTVPLARLASEIKRQIES